MGQAVDWWPLLLIGAGVAIIFSGTLGVLATALAGVLVGILIGGFIGGAASFPTSCGTGDPLPLRAFEDGSLGGAADVEIDLNCVTLEVAGWRRCTTGSSRPMRRRRTASRLRLMTARSASGPSDTVVLGSEHRLHVGVTVPGEERDEPVDAR